MRVYLNGAQVANQEALDFREGDGVAIAVSEESPTNGAVSVTVSTGGSVTYVHAPTGVVAADKVVLADAISDTAAGGIVMLANGGDTPYATDVPWVIDKQLTVVGAGAAEVGFGSGGRPTASPWLTGSVVLQTAAGVDAIQLPGTQTRVNLRDFGIRFDDAIMFSDTGHGINTTPAEVFGAGHQIGLMDALWQNVLVFGHDGNHYARLIVNGILNTYINMGSFGGGVAKYVQDSDVISSGNSVDLNPYGCMFVAGTAHAYAFSGFAAAGSTGGINLLTFDRPQCDMVNQSGDATIGNPAAPTISQYLWQSAADGGHELVTSLIMAPDLENDDSVSHPINFGSAAAGNVVIPGGSANLNGVQNQVTPGYVHTGAFAVGPLSLAAWAGTSGNGNTAIGKSALAALQTGSNNTALGKNAATAATAASALTALGSLALAAATTGNNNTAVGSGALGALTTGTANVAVGDQAATTAVTTTGVTAIGSSALQLATGDSSTAVGSSAGGSVTTGADNTYLGYKSGVTNTSANATTTGARQVAIGREAGQSVSSQLNEIVAVGYRAQVGGGNGTAIGSRAVAGAAGSVAIGHDSAGGTVSTSVQDQIALGTALHHVLLKKATAPADASLAASQFTFWLTDTPGSAKLNVKAKDSAGTVVTGTVTLA